METIEHFAHISLVARLLGRENLIAREELTRLQELRGTYGIAAPAPICADPPASPGAPSDAATCQVVQSPMGGGLRLVPTAVDAALASGDGEGEIRLTDRQLSALIEDAIRSLR
jgi:L-fuculose-phosphate aldolase